MSTLAGLGFLQPGARGQRSEWQWKGTLRCLHKRLLSNFKQPGSPFPVNRGLGRTDRDCSSSLNLPVKTANSRVLWPRDLRGVIGSTCGFLVVPLRSTLLTAGQPGIKRSQGLAPGLPSSSNMTTSLEGDPDRKKPCRPALAQEDQNSNSARRLWVPAAGAS